MGKKKAFKGEATVRSFEFYTAFTTPREMDVVHKTHRVGSIAAVPGMEADGYLILAGRRWRILDIDLEMSVINVEPSKGGRVPLFKGITDVTVHPRVREEMLEVLCSDKEPAYLDTTAKEMLTSARGIAAETGITRQRLLQDGSDTLWFTWTGSRVHSTLIALGLHYAGLKVMDMDGVAIRFSEAKIDEVKASYRKFLSHCPTALELASHFEVKVSEKYDGYLSEEVQNHLFATNRLDVEGAVSVVSQTF